MTAYYTTELDSIGTILRDSIHADSDGLVHLSADRMAAGRERGFRPAGPIAAVVFLVDVDKEAVQPYQDHIVHHGDIPRSQVGPVVRILGSPQAVTGRRNAAR